MTRLNFVFFIHNSVTKLLILPLLDKKANPIHAYKKKPLIFQLPHIMIFKVYSMSNYKKYQHLFISKVPF